MRRNTACRSGWLRCANSCNSSLHPVASSGDASNSPSSSSICAAVGCFTASNVRQSAASRLLTSGASPEPWRPFGSSSIAVSAGGAAGSACPIASVCCAALVRRTSSSSPRRQHFLYFRPLPHGQGSLRPVFIRSRAADRHGSEAQSTAGSRSRRSISALG